MKHNIITVAFTLLLTACGGGDTSHPAKTVEDSTPQPTTSSSPTEEVVNEINQTREVLPSPNSTSSPTLTTPLPTNNTEVQIDIPQLPTSSSSQSVAEPIKETIEVQENTITVDAGEDINMSVNDTVTLTGIVNNLGTETIFYEWKKGINLLGTTISLNYTPKEEDALPTAGVRIDTLTFSISNSDGILDSDKINITVLP